MGLAGREAFHAGPVQRMVKRMVKRMVICHVFALGMLRGCLAAQQSGLCFRCLRVSPPPREHFSHRAPLLYGDVFWASNKPTGFGRV